MEEAISLDLNGKLALKLRLVRGQVVVARTGWADRLAAGQFLKIVDPHGKQAGDFWAFNADNPDEHLSAMHTRVWVNRLCPRPGESFQTNHRRPILQLVQDTCGVHDLLTAPCDEHRYRLYGVQGEQLGIYPEAEIPTTLGGVGKMCSFGEGISMTPLQLGALVSAIANGGTLYYLQHPNRPEDVLTTGPDHAADAARYAVMESNYKSRATNGRLIYS